MSNRPGISITEYERADEFRISDSGSDYWECVGLDDERVEIPKCIAKSKEDARSVLAYALTAHSTGYQRGLSAGRIEGRKAIHELLGIDRIATELDAITRALYEIRGA